MLRSTAAGTAGAVAVADDSEAAASLQAVFGKALWARDRPSRHASGREPCAHRAQVHPRAPLAGTRAEGAVTNVLRLLEIHRNVFSGAARARAPALPSSRARAARAPPQRDAGALPAGHSHEIAVTPRGGAPARARGRKGWGGVHQPPPTPPARARSNGQKKNGGPKPKSGPGACRVGPLLPPPPPPPRARATCAPSRCGSRAAARPCAAGPSPGTTWRPAGRRGARGGGGGKRGARRARSGASRARARRALEMAEEGGGKRQKRGQGSNARARARVCAGAPVRCGVRSWFGSVWSGLVCQLVCQLVWCGVVWFGVVWIGVPIGLVWFGLV